MIESAHRTGQYESPWRTSPAVWEFFSDESDLLRHLQQTWRNHLAGAVYVAIEAGDGDLQADVAKAFATIAQRHEPLRRVLKAHADHPAIAQAMRKEKALLSSFMLGMGVEDHTLAA